MNFAPSFKPQKILVIKLRKLGDVLGTTPSVRQLKLLYPKAEITFLSEPLGAQVYAFSTHIKEVWVLNQNPSYWEYLKMIAKVHQGNFDIIIDLYHHNKTALITMLSGARCRLGFIHENEKVWSYNYTVSLTQHEKNHVNRTHHQLKLTNLIGTNFDDDQIEFEINDDTKKFAKEFSLNHNFGSNTIAFCVQSEREGAQVPVGLWTEIGDYLIEKGYKLIFIYGPGEREKAEQVYKTLSKKKLCIIDYDVPKIAEARAILEQCVMYIGNDGGNKHLAVASGIPTIGLFYGDSPKVWTPNEPHKHRYLQTKNISNQFVQFKEIFESYNRDKVEFLDHLNSNFS